MPLKNIEKLLPEREQLITDDYSVALDFGEIPKSSTVLDVATGSGRMLEQLLLRGYSVISGDIDPDAIKRTKERLGKLADKATLVILDAEKMEFRDESFDAAVLANAIHEMDCPRAALDEILRVLKPNGKFLVVEFNSKGYDLMELHHKIEGKGVHRHGEMPSEDIDRFLRSAFSDVKKAELQLTFAWIASGKLSRKR